MKWPDSYWNWWPVLLEYALDEHQTFQIRRASNYYSGKVFEYPAIGEAVSAYSGNPDTNTLIEVAEKLVDVLREPCLKAG